MKVRKHPDWKKKKNLQPDSIGTRSGADSVSKTFIYFILVPVCVIKTVSLVFGWIERVRKIFLSVVFNVSPWNQRRLRK